MVLFSEGFIRMQCSVEKTSDTLAENSDALVLTAPLCSLQNGAVESAPGTSATAGK